MFKQGGRVVFMLLFHFTGNVLLFLSLNVQVFDLQKTLKIQNSCINRGLFNYLY